MAGRPAAAPPPRIMRGRPRSLEGRRSPSPLTRGWCRGQTSWRAPSRWPPAPGGGAWGAGGFCFEGGRLRWLRALLFWRGWCLATHVGASCLTAAPLVAFFCFAPSSTIQTPPQPAPLSCLIAQPRPALQACHPAPPSRPHLVAEGDLGEGLKALPHHPRRGAQQQPKVGDVQHSVVCTARAAGMAWHSALSMACTASSAAKEGSGSRAQQAAQAERGRASQPA